MSPDVACTGCGEAVPVEPEGLDGSLLDIAERLIAGELEMLCAPCSDARDAEEAADAGVAARLRRTRARQSASDIPEKWIPTDWDDLDRDDRATAIAAAERWSRAEAKRPGLLLYGPVGRGKSRIAGTAAVARLRMGPVRWLNIARLVMDLRMPMTSPEYQAAQRALVPGRLTALVLDDLDKLPPTEAAVQAIYLAVNEWTEAGRPLLITSNKDPEGIATDFGPRYGAAIASRLVEHCNIYPVEGRDRRTE